MKYALKEKLLQQLKLKQPALGTDKTYTKCIDKYVDTMLVEIAAMVTTEIRDERLADDCHYFAKTRISRAMGRVGTKKQRYIYDAMEESNATSLLLEQKKGYAQNGNKRLTVVKFNPLYFDLIVDALIDWRTQPRAFHAEADCTDLLPVIVPINPHSLQAFIEQCVCELRQAQSYSAYERATFRNLVAARQVQALTCQADYQCSSPYVVEYWKTADSGRRYGHGVSLQRLSKEVRNAALGRCHKYDMKAAAFAVMAGLAQQINPQLQLTALPHYIKHRQSIRQRIAAELDIGVDVVKEIFTALGFGAELKDNVYSAIRGALSKEARKKWSADGSSEYLPREIYNSLGLDEFVRLTMSETFAQIHAELQMVNATILRAFEGKAIEINSFTCGNFTNKRKKGKRGNGEFRERTDKHKLAWIYHALETMAMEMFIDCVDQKPLLVVHDCVYYKEDLSKSLLRDITDELQQTFPYFSVEHEVAVPIAGYGDDGGDEDCGEWRIGVRGSSEQRASYWQSLEAEDTLLQLATLSHNCLPTASNCTAYPLSR